MREKSLRKRLFFLKFLTCLLNFELVGMPCDRKTLFFGERSAKTVILCSGTNGRLVWPYLAGQPKFKCIERVKFVEMS